MASTIQIKRGLKANLPASAAAGELLVTTDSHELSIGTGAGLASLVVDAANVTNLPAVSEPVNAQTGTSYTVLNGDRGKLLTLSNAGAVAVTLPQAGAGASFIAGWYADIANKGAGDVTITPTTSTIDGAATLVLHTGQSATVVSDGTNYQIAAGRKVTGATAQANKWISAIAADGAATLTQPAFTDVSGTLAASQLPSVIDGGTF